ESEEDQHELRGEHGASQHPGPQRTISLEQANAAPMTPEEYQHGGERGPPDRLEDWVVADVRDLDEDLVEAPRHGEQHHGGGREAVNRVAAVQFPGSRHAFSSSTRSSKPSNFQLCRMCGGSGAVTSITPRSGCGLTIRRA